MVDWFVATDRNGSFLVQDRSDIEDRSRLADRLGLVFGGLTAGTLTFAAAFLWMNAGEQVYLQDLLNSIASCF